MDEQGDSLLEKITDGFLSLDGDWRITYANGEAARLNGITREQMIGRTYWELFAGSADGALHNEFARAVREQVPVEFESVDEHSKRWFHFKAYPVTGGLSLFFDEITARKAAENALRESEERFRALAAMTPECVIMLSSEGTVYHANACGAEMLGADSPGEVIGKSVFDLIAPENRAAGAAFLEAIRSPEVKYFKFDAPGAQGEQRHYETNAAPVHGPDGRILQLWVIRDVTERRIRDQAAMLLSVVVESSDDAIIGKDLDGIITSWNQGAERLFGYTADEVIGKSITILMPPDRLVEEAGILARLRRGERIDHLETVRRRKDGKLLNISLTISPIRDAQGKPIGASKIARDISDVKRSERAALLLGAIVDSSDDAIISKDLNGTITSWNHSAERVFGYTAAEAIGQPITMLIPDGREEEEPEILRRLTRGERIDHFETVRRRKDGQIIQILATISPVKDSSGVIIGASKVARDISDRKHTEKHIEQLNAQLMADLSAMTRLQELSTRVAQAEDLPQLLGEIVEASIAITGADMGCVQLAEDGGLKIVAQRGFESPLVEYFSRLEDGGTACMEALKSSRRVIVENVEENELFRNTEGLAVILQAGVRALQSTPLLSRSGMVLGVFSTHYQDLRQPNTRDQRLLDILSRIAADLIERKCAESALLASEEKFRQLADSMPQIVWTAQPDGRPDYYNQRWFDFSGLSRDEFGDASWTNVIHPEDEIVARERWQHSVASGEPYHIEYRFRDPQENRWRWFLGRALAVRDSDGAIIKWFGSCTDIDEQKRVEGELRRANLDLEQFAYSASHDLQEPLRSIKIYSELLTSRYAGVLDGQAAEFLNYLRLGATRMEGLVRDLLEYTQVTGIEVPTECVDANAAAAVAIANLSSAIVQNRAEVACDALPQVPVHGTHLKQLFQNLIGNAIKYRSPERDPRVHVSATAQDGAWLFSVADNGIGIEAEYQLQIFGLFKRLHAAYEYSGTGIGLAICKRIVERYHGRIWIDSTPGQGSTFYFTLPA